MRTLFHPLFSLPYARNGVSRRDDACLRISPRETEMGRELWGGGRQEMNDERRRSAMLGAQMLCAIYQRSQINFLLPRKARNLLAKDMRTILIDKILLVVPTTSSFHFSGSQARGSTRSSMLEIESKKLICTPRFTQFGPKRPVMCGKIFNAPSTLMFVFACYSNGD